MDDMFDLNNNGSIDAGEGYLRNNELNGGSGGSGGSSGDSEGSGCGSTIIMLLVIALCGWLDKQGIGWPFTIITWLFIIVIIIVISQAIRK